MACSYLAGPKFNDDDNRKEQESLTCAERREAQDDIFGVGCRRRVEDDELRAQSLQQLRAAIDDFSDDEKEEYLEARRRNADTTVSDGELLPFLRSANYNPLDAAQRLMAYWRRRISLFGPARAFERLSVGGTLTGDEDDMFANSMNFLSISEVTDEHKRKVLCLHLGTQKTNCKQNSLVSREGLGAHFF